VIRGVEAEIFKGCETFKDGYLYANEAPGWGIEIDEKLAAKHPFRSDGPRGSLNADGASSAASTARSSNNRTGFITCVRQLNSAARPALTCVGDAPGWSPQASACVSRSERHQRR